MRKMLFCAVFLLLAVGFTNAHPDIASKGCGRGKYPAGGGDRIVGGGFVRHGQYPWMVSLFVKKGSSDFSHECGGSIINENWILTAAHCVQFLNEPWRYEIYAGLHKLSELSASIVQHLKVSELHVHEAFNWTTSRDDLALLKTAQPIDIEESGGFVNSICLPSSNKDPERFARALGWGYTGSGTGNGLSDTLKQVVVPIVDRQKCNQVYKPYALDGGDYIVESMICAGAKGKSPCHQDSGGPLFQTDSKGVSTLYGVASFGVGCGSTEEPMVFVKVSLYRDWIRGIIEA